MAEIQIPEGYKFTDASGAKTLLEKMKNPVPKGLMGIVAPNAGGWWMILQFSEVGYVKEDGADAMDPNLILKALNERVNTQNIERARLDLAPVSDVEWAIQPTYDTTTKTLEWAVKAQAASDVVLNHTVRLLSRRGFLDGIDVRPFRAEMDLATVRHLMDGVTFKEGQQYANMQPGDKMAAKSLADLIVTDGTETDSQVAQAKVTGTSGIWVSLGAVLLLVCFVAAGGTVLVKKLRTKAAENAPLPAAPAEQEAKPASNPQPAPATRPVLIKTTRPKAAGFKVRPATVNGASAKTANQYRTFDYNRYFIDLMSNVYGGSYGADLSVGAADQEETNGYAGHGANGKTVNGAGAGDAEILAAQKSLIHEQRRLIQEQSKLIEEKSRLIEEKNSILRMQANLMDRKLV